MTDMKNDLRKRGSANEQVAAASASPGNNGATFFAPRATVPAADYAVLRLSDSEVAAIRGPIARQ